jgi:hypothetical protein
VTNTIQNNYHAIHISAVISSVGDIYFPALTVSVSIELVVFVFLTNFMCPYRSNILFFCSVQNTLLYACSVSLYLIFSRVPIFYSETAGKINFSGFQFISSIQLHNHHANIH